jgi:hypothetical protein
MPIAWNLLEKNGCYYATKEIVKQQECYEHFYKQGYDFIIEQMEKRGLPRPSPEHYPIWAWVVRRKRTITPKKLGRSFLKGEQRVFIEFDIPDHLVLLSDFDRFIHVLNYWYLPNSEEDSEQFIAELKQHGLDFFKTKPLPNEKYHKLILQSWERIFELDTEYPYVNSSSEERTIQATFWELKLEWVSRHFLFEGNVADSTKLRSTSELL